MTKPLTLLLAAATLLGAVGCGAKDDATVSGASTATPSGAPPTAASGAPTAAPSSATPSDATPQGKAAAAAADGTGPGGK